jgi:hypothetical protein
METKASVIPCQATSILRDLFLVSLPVCAMAPTGAQRASVLAAAPRRLQMGMPPSRACKR